MIESLFHTEEQSYELHHDNGSFNEIQSEHFVMPYLGGEDPTSKVILSSFLEPIQPPPQPTRKGVPLRLDLLSAPQPRESEDVRYLTQKCESLQSQIRDLAQKLDSVTMQISKKNTEDYNTNHSSKLEKAKYEKKDLENMLGTAGFNLEDLTHSLNVMKQLQKFTTTEGPAILGPKDKLVTDEFGYATRDDNSGGLMLKNFKNADLKILEFGTSEDEFKTLTAIEFLISENKILEAIKLIKWRKKIIKLAHLNGWDVAKIIAKNTIDKLDITATDIIISNLCFLQQNEHVIGLKAVDMDDINVESV
jgi:hypothetical protein